MKAIKYTGTALALIAVFLASCSTPRLAQNNSTDDVYNTTAKARVYSYVQPQQDQQQSTSSQQADNSYASSDYNYDMDYSSRIDRFYYNNPYRPYFDDYYNFYGYNSWYTPNHWSLGFSFGWGWNSWRYNTWNYNPWYNPYYSSWYYYGAPYYWNTWGPYSYYNPWYGGGYYGGNVIIRNNENYRPRPSRSTENRIGTRPNGSVIDRNSRGNVQGNGTITAPRTQGNTSGNSGETVRDTRPSRSSGNNEGAVSRPTRTSETTSRPVYTPPPSNSGSSSSGSSSSGSSSSSGGSRPVRGGGR